MGGFTKALEAEYPQEQILDILKQRFKALDFRKDRAVGNNMYPNMAEELIEPRPEDTPTLKKQLVKGVEDYRKDMDKEYLGKSWKNWKHLRLPESWIRLSKPFLPVPPRTRSIRP